MELPENRKPKTCFTQRRTVIKNSYKIVVAAAREAVFALNQPNLPVM